MRIARLVFLSFFFLAGTLRAQSSAELVFTIKPLGHNVWAAIGNPKGAAGSNAGFVIGDDGVAVIDSFESPGAARQLLAEIRKRTNLPIKFVINTHYHLDHVGGNLIFQEAGAVILAHRNVREWIHTENLKFFPKDLNLAQKAKVDGLAAPELIYDHAVGLYLGTRSIQVVWRPGYTGGDSVVTVPDSHVVFCGDLFWRKSLPNLIDASTGPWMTTLDILARSNPAGAFVPGHGDVGTATDVTEFREYLTSLRKFVGSAQGQGKSGDALVEAVLPALMQHYGQWDLFQDFAKKNILDTGAELRGEKKIPRPVEIE